MGSLAISGKTALLEVATEVPPVAPATWTGLTEITTIGNFNADRAVYDATFHGPSDHSDQILGRRLPIELDFTANFIHSVYVAEYWSKFSNKTAGWYRIFPPEGDINGYWLFEAFIKTLAVVTPIDGLIAIEGSFAVTQDYDYVEP